MRFFSGKNGGEEKFFVKKAIFNLFTWKVYWWGLGFIFFGKIIV